MTDLSGTRRIYDIEVMSAILILISEPDYREHRDDAKVWAEISKRFGSERTDAAKACLASTKLRPGTHSEEWTING